MNKDISQFTEFIKDPIKDPSQPFRIFMMMDILHLSKKEILEMDIIERIMAYQYVKASYIGKNNLGFRKQNKKTSDASFNYNRNTNDPTFVSKVN